MCLRRWTRQSRLVGRFPSRRCHFARLDLNAGDATMLRFRDQDKSVGRHGQIVWRHVVSYFFDSAGLGIDGDDAILGPLATVE